MTHAHKDPKNEKFHTRLISDDETKYVDTSYTIGELEETLDTLTNAAIFQENPVALKIVSLFAFATKKFEDALEELSMAQARFEAFRESVQEIQQLPSWNVKESLVALLEVDEELHALLTSSDEFM